MELRHLRYFVAVAEEGHITRAAERLGLQQPPLSQQIRALESELDVQLFRRKPRGVELTEAGRALLDDARAVLSQVEHAVATARRTARGEQGRIAVGFTSSASFHPLVVRAIRSYRDAYPLVSLALEEGGTAELVDALRQDQLDAAFIRTPVGDASALTVMPLLEEEMVAALPTGHALVRRKRTTALPLSGLSAETFILYRRRLGPGLYDAIIAACHRAGFSPRVGQEAPRMFSTLNLVAAGLGVSIIPASMQALHMDGVVYRRLSGAPVKAPLRLACRRGETAPAVRRFVELVGRAAKAPPR
ncbi:MAG TPA: LysR family transcriptional regulator [Alphaproteobacteria bacterium]